MTQAFNLSQFANKVDSTGKADLTTAVTGTLPVANGGTSATTVSGARTALGLGTSATLNAGTSANNVVQLDSSAKLPAVDGSQLTGLATSTLLGTLSTTSGSSVSLNSLDLSSYKFLKIICNNVAGQSYHSLRIQSIIASMITDQGSSIWGIYTICLSNGVYSSSLSTSISTTGTSSAVGEAWAGNLGIINSTTSITFSMNSGNFTAGTILVYGIK